MNFLQLNTPDIFQVNEFYMVPLCLVIILIVGYKSHKSFENATIRKYYYIGLWLKIAFTGVFIMVMSFYYKSGDTFTYFQAIKDLRKALGDDLNYIFDIYGNGGLTVDNPILPYFAYDGTGFTHYYMFNGANYAVPKAGLPFSLLFGGSYICISLCLSFLAYIGCWKIFSIFYKLYPALYKHAAFSILFLPSIVFWGVGLIKDSISMAALGFLFYALYNFFFTKNSKLLHGLIALVAGFILINVKSYIFLSFMVGFMIWLFLSFKNLIQNVALRRVAGFAFIVAALGSSYFMVQSFEGSEIGDRFTTENIVESVIQQNENYNLITDKGTTFSVGEIENSFTGIALLFPMGVVSTLFRPFPWEISNPMMLISAIEALAFVYLTLICFIRIGFFKTFKMLYTNPFTAFCFTYSFLFAGFVGLSTPNFGTLMRYKIPCLSFYLMAIFVIMYQSGKFSTKYIFSKRLF